MNRKEIVIIAVSIVLLYAWKPAEFLLTKLLSTKPVTIDTEKQSNMIVISINNKLKHAHIQNNKKKVSVGDIIVIESAGIVQKMLISEYLISEIPISDMLCFTIPGKTGKYQLGKSSPTAIEIQKNGTMQFSLCYPETWSHFTTAKRQQDGSFKQSLAKVSFNKAKTFPRTFSEPRQITRLNGLAGAVLPEIEIENQYPNFDLENEVKKELKKGGYHANH